MSCGQPPPPPPPPHSTIKLLKYSVLFIGNTYILYRIYTDSLAGVGSFDSDEGQHFRSSLYQGARLLIHVHTPFTPFYSISFLLKELKV